MDSARCAGALLCDALELEGLPPRLRTTWRRRPRGAIWRWSEGGTLPIVIDASSCAHGLLEDVAPRLPESERERFEQIEVLDSISWVHDRLLENLQVRHKLATAAVHPTCSAARMGLSAKLEAIAGELADEVVIPAASCMLWHGRRPRHAASRATRLSPARRRRRRWANTRSMCISAATAPARSACRRSQARLMPRLCWRLSARRAPEISRVRRR